MAKRKKPSKPSTNGHSSSNGHSSPNGKPPKNGLHEEFETGQHPNNLKPIFSGRARTLTPDKKQQIIAFVAGGGSRRRACMFVGIAYTQFSLELTQRDPEFARQVEEAEAGNYLIQIGRVQEAAKKQWQAAAWLLERKYPEEFARTINTNIGGQKDGRPVPIVEIDIDSRDAAKRFVKMQSDLAVAMGESDPDADDDLD